MNGETDPIGPSTMKSSKRQLKAGAPHRTGRAQFRHPALRFVVPRGGMRGGYVDQLRTARGLWQRAKRQSPFELLPGVGAAL